MGPALLVIKRGEHGVLVTRDRFFAAPAMPLERVVDPTGAGDVFAAAYLVGYRETGEPLEAARFASCAASICVEAGGLAGVPTLGQVNARLASEAQQAFSSPGDATRPGPN